MLGDTPVQRLQYPPLVLDGQLLNFIKQSVVTHDLLSCSHCATDSLPLQSISRCSNAAPASGACPGSPALLWLLASSPVLGAFLIAHRPPRLYYSAHSRASLEPCPPAAFPDLIAVCLVIDAHVRLDGLPAAATFAIYRHSTAV